VYSEYSVLAYDLIPDVVTVHKRVTYVSASDCECVYKNSFEMHRKREEEKEREKNNKRS
jgi:hypothetical protein